jgi:hypothetical protein
MSDATADGEVPVSSKEWDGSSLAKRARRKAPTITVKSVRDKPLQISLDPVEAERLMSALGTVELGFANLMLGGIINAACDGGSARPPGEEDINRVLAAVTGIGARDETEGMLATQMVATHFAAMGVLRRLKGSETIPQQDSNGNLAAKLLRTFTMQVEALQRYRGKGQQKVTVEHVHVHAGGQAIVGTVTPGGGDARKSKDQPHAYQRREPQPKEWSPNPRTEALWQQKPRGEGNLTAPQPCIEHVSGGL